jgi:hypothetical protein
MKTPMTICTTVQTTRDTQRTTIARTQTVAFANTVTTQQTKNLARLKIWRAVMPGTALGVLLEVLTKDDKLPVHIGSIFSLFLAWQVTIAAVIGYCIIPRTGDCKRVAQ